MEARLRWLSRSLKLDYPGGLSDFFRLAVWMLGLALLIGLLWVATSKEIERSDQEARHRVMQQAQSLALSYATQLEHIAEHVDRLTLSVAYRWSESPDRVDLDRDRARGLFPERHEFFVSVVDDRGTVAHSSFEGKKNTRLAGADFFRLHRDGCCASLLTTGPDFGSSLGQPVIRFSRRLERADGHFAGAVVVSVAPDYLATFQNEGLQEGANFFSAHLPDGATLVTRLGSGDDGARVLFRQAPRFQREHGVQLASGESFHDGRARYVAWHRLERYPLVAVVGLSEDHALAATRAAQRTHRRNAIIATVFLGILAIAGILISTRFASRRRAEEAVRRTYRMATDAANEGFYMLTPIFDGQGELRDFRIEDCNERAAVLLGLLRTRLIGRRASDVMPDRTRAEMAALCSRALGCGVCEDELQVPAHGWIRATWVYRRAVHSGTGIALTLRDISDLKAHQQALADMANQDALTQLPNRRWLSGFLPAALQRAERDGRCLALLFIDLDNFKEINDTMGHPVGDRLLVEAAARIRAAVHGSDHIARLGGDEFTVVLERFESTEAVAAVAADVIARLSQPYTVPVGQASPISASVGISLFPGDGADAETLIKHADVAMYAAKAEGKGRHHFYEPALSEALLRRLGMAQALRTAIERDEFVVYYQPRVSAISGRLCSLEALVRWQQPGGELMMPSEFVPAAEQAGLIVRIGNRVIDMVAAQLAQWRDQGLSPVPVSVNVSPCHLNYASPSTSIARALERHGLPAKWMEVEITESSMVEHGDGARRELDALRALGVCLMIDDFGTGYSSLAQLHQLNVDVLKVDQAFTRSLAQGSEGEQVYRAIVSMAAALDMHVVAEGVETAEQLRTLQAIGCDEIQGYIIAPPMPADQLSPMLAVPRLALSGGGALPVSAVSSWTG